MSKTSHFFKKILEHIYIVKKLRLKHLISLLKILTFIIPFFLFATAINYSDVFYFVLGLIFIIFAIFINTSSLLKDKRLRFPSKKVKLDSLNIPKEVESLTSKKSLLKLKRTLYIPYLILAITTVSLLSFYSVNKTSLFPHSNIFVMYVYSNLSFMAKNSLYLILVSVSYILLIIFFWFRSKTKIKSLIFNSLAGIAVILISFAISAGIVFGYAGFRNYVLLNSLVKNPVSHGLLKETDQILENIKSRNINPVVVGLKDNSQLAYKVLEIKNSKYQGELFRNVLNYTSKKIKHDEVPDSSLYLYNNHLFITRIDKTEIEKISPTLGKLIVRNSLNPKYVKDEPTVQIMSRSEYLVYRDEQINEAVSKLDDVVKNLNILISKSYANINQAKSEITSYENWLANSVSNRDYEYGQCISATCYTYSYSYYTGYYSIPYRCNSDAYCNSKRQQWDIAISNNQSSLQEWRVYLRNEQAYLRDTQELKSLMEDYRTMVNLSKEQAPYELGLFEPDRTIKVVLENTNTDSLSDFYAILVHEYLHYTSYVSTERELEKFFEEGLTEYFARQIVKKQFGYETNLGYPVFVPIVEKIIQDLGEETVKDIYFSKNQELLVSLLNEKYGKNFYDESWYYFFALQYVGGEDSLKIANNIMFRIGGREIRREDIFINSN
jgi:hypothetical protein